MADKPWIEEADDGLLVASCTAPQFDKLRSVAASDLVEGIYHVCGQHPWLIIRRSSHLADSDRRYIAEREALTNLLRYVKTGPAIWASIDDESTLTEPIDPNDRRLQTFIFIKPLDIVPFEREKWVAERVKPLIELTRLPRGIEVRRVLWPHTCEWWLFIEVLAESVGPISQLLYLFESEEIRATTKLCLVRWRDRDQFQPYSEFNQRREAEFRQPLKLGASEKVAAAVRNDPSFLSRPPADRVAEVIRLFAREGSPTTAEERALFYEQLVPSPLGRYAGAGEVRHTNPFVSRESVRPASESWTMTFCFLRARRSSSQKAKSGQVPMTALRNALTQKIDIRPNWAIQGFYEITGDYDFILPVWTSRYLTPLDIVDMLSHLPIDGAPSMIQGELPEYRRLPAVPSPLSSVGTAISLALARNSENIDEFWAELQEVVSASESSRDRVLESCSPRLHEVAHALESTSPSTMPLPRLQDLGFTQSWETHQAHPYRAFIRCHAADLETLRELDEKIRKRTGRLPGERTEIDFEYFKGIRPEIFGIAAFYELSQLERFLHLLRGDGVRTEFHVVLEHGAPYPNLPPENRCAPCSYGSLVSSGDGSDASKAPQQADKSIVSFQDDPELNCSACSRYAKRPRPAESDDFLKVRVRLEDRESEDWRQKKLDAMRDVSIGLLDMRIQTSDLLYLGAVPNNLPVADASEFDLAAGWRLGCGEYDPAAHASHVFEFLSESKLLQCNLLVLPEYTVPQACFLYLVRHLQAQHQENELPDREQIFVLGSHLDARGYSTSPILYRRPGYLRVFFQQKAVRSNLEESVALPPRMASGAYVFVTQFGNVLVPVCRDADIADSLSEDIDIAAVPSFHGGARPTLDRGLKSLRARRRVVAFANGATPARDVRLDSYVGWTDEEPPAPTTEFEPIHRFTTSSVLRPTVGQPHDVVLEARAVTKTVDLIGVDRMRVDKEHPGRPGLFPVHFDLWKDEPEAQDQPPDLLWALDLIEHRATRHAPREMSDYLSLDWEEAERRWARGLDTSSS